MHPLSLLSLFLLPSLSLSALTATNAVTLATSLLEHSSPLEDALNHYKTAQIQIAAIKLKSLIPAHSANGAFESSKLAAAVSEAKQLSDDDDSASESDNSADNSSDNSDDEDDGSDVDDIPTANSLLLSSFASLIKSLDTDSLAQINSFDFSFQSVDDFVTVKEQEAAQKLQEALHPIHQLQQLLFQSHPSKSQNTAVSSKLLARLVAKMDALEEEFEDIQSLQKRLKSSKEEKRVKAKKELADSHVKIQKIVQRLSEIVSE